MAGCSGSAMSLHRFLSAPLIVKFREFGIASITGFGPSSVSAPPNPNPITGVDTSICNIERPPVLVCAKAVTKYTLPYLTPPLICDTAVAPLPGPLPIGQPNIPALLVPQMVIVGS